HWGWRCATGAGVGGPGRLRLRRWHGSVGRAVDVTASGPAGRLCGRGGRDQTPQPPVLETGALPIELLPSGRAGARTPSVAAALRRASAGSNYATAARRRERAKISAAAVPAVASAAPPMAPAYASPRPARREATGGRPP